MEPRIILIAQYPSDNGAHVWEVLRSIGMWVFGRDQNAVWQLREQLSVAHGVLVVLERPMSPDNKSFELELAELLRYREEQNSGLPVMVVYEHLISLPPELRTFRTAPFDERLQPPDLRRIVEFVFEAARAPDTTTPDLDLLLARGNVEVNRLKLIAAEAQIHWVWPIIALVVALAGLALSIPDLLSRLGLPDYWLLIGPVVFIIGGLTTLQLYRRRTRRLKQRKIAIQLTEELSSVLSQLQKSIEPFSESRPIPEASA